MKRWLRWLVLLVVVALAGRWLWQRIFVTEEGRVRRTLAAMESAVEKGKMLQLQGLIASDYADDQGMDKQTLLGAVMAFRQQYPQIFIHISDLTITIAPDGQTAEAVLIARILAAAATGRDHEIRSDRYRLKLRKVDDTWKMYSAETPELKFE